MFAFGASGLLGSQSFRQIDINGLAPLFNDVFTNKIFWHGGRVYTTDYDFFLLKENIPGNVINTAYIDPSALPGTGTELNPFNNISIAFSNASFNVYLFKSGSRFTGINAAINVPSTRPIRIGTYGGNEPAYITSQLMGMSWTQNGTYSVVYQAANPQTSLNIGSALDETNIDPRGYPIGFKRAASILEVSTTPNSFFYDATADIVYLRTFNDRVPDSDIRCFLSSTTLRLLRLGSSVAGGSQFYIENIRLLGAQPLIVLGTNNIDDYLVGFSNCHFSHGGQKDGIFFSGNCKGFANNCVADYNAGDGFNYNHTVGFLLEWYCKSYGNSITNVSSNNGSTSHGNFRVIRVGGDYENMAGKPVQDINNSKSISIGCRTSDSKGVLAIDRAAFASDSANPGNTEMWLIHCIGDEDELKFWNFSTSIMYIYDGNVGNLLTGTNRQDVGSTLNILTDNNVFV